MNRKSRLQIAAGTAALYLGALMPAFGQAAPAASQAATPAPSTDQMATPIVKMQEFVVNGQESSLASAQQIKEESQSIVDSIVASDIDKLPDINAAYALERITGVQVAHIFAGLGGNGAVTIDGLTQIENTIDGREVFTAGGTSGGGVGNGQRTYSYSDIASSLIAGIDVYKSSAANQLDGGLGGLIDVRLHRPFDWDDGYHAAVTLGTTYSGLQSEDKPNYNLLITDSEKTSMGRVGVMVDATYQVQPWREDNLGIGNPTAASTAVTGDPGALIASSYTQTSYGGVFQTTGVNTVFQWQPGPNLQLYAGYNFEEWYNIENQEELSIGLSAATVNPGSAILFPGSQTAVESASFSNVTGSSFGIIRDLTDRSRQFYVGGTWTQGDLTVKSDLSRYDTANGFYNNGVLASVSIPGFYYNLSSTIPSGIVTGGSLYDSTRYTLSQVYNRLDPSTGYETAGTVDASYKLAGSFINEIDAGIRYQGTEDDNGTTGLYLGAYNFPSTANLLSEHPSNLFGPAWVQNYFSGYKEPEVTQYLAGSTTNLRNVALIQSLWGDPTPNPSADASASTSGATTMVNPLSLFHIDESTAAFYLMPKFAANLGGLPIDGNFGVRLVQTNDQLGGFQTVTSAALSSTGTAVLGPISISNHYLDVLPSLNARLKLAPDTFIRVAASKTITRPNFSSISPSLTLNQNPVTPANNTAAQGNPYLKPVHSENVNVSLEKYFNKDTSVYIGGLYKKVTGFITSFSEPETFGGVTYQTSTSINLNPATIKGAEAGYQQFFKFLPEPFDGLGIQANIAYLQSTTPSSVQGYNIPLTNLSRETYNLVLMYEKGPFSARLAYNWRDKYVTGVSSFVGVGLVPQFVKAYSDVDASINYQASKNVEVTVQGVNLTNTLRYQYWNNQNTPSNDYLDGLTLMASVTYRY